MSVKIAVYGAPIDLADELEEEFYPIAKAAVTEGAELLLQDVQARLRLHWGTFQTAAPAGAPPEYDVGDLYRSFRLLPPRVRGRVVSAGVGSDDPAANRLEFGKTDILGIRTFPHPFMAPALAAVEGPITALFALRFSVSNVETLSQLNAP